MLSEVLDFSADPPSIWCTDTVYPARPYLSWRENYLSLDSIGRRLRSKDFVCYLREHVYSKYPTGGGVPASTFYSSENYPQTCERWYNAVAHDSIELVCGDFSNVLHLNFDLWNMRTCNFLMSTQKFSYYGGSHVQTLVEVIDTFHGILDTVYSVQDAMTNYTYVWSDGELMDIRDMVILLLTNKKDSICVTANSTLAPNLDTTACSLGYDNNQIQEVYFEHSLSKTTPYRSYAVRSNETYQLLYDSIAADWGYPGMDFFGAKDLSQSILFINHWMVNGVSSKHYHFWKNFFEDIDSLKLAYGFNPCAGIYPPDTIRNWKSVKADIKAKLSHKNSIQDTLVELLYFTRNVIRFGDVGSCKLETGSHSAEEWFRLFEADSVITNYSGAADFFGKLCEEFGFKSGKYFIGTADLTTAVFTVIHDSKEEKYYLLEPTFGLYCTDTSGYLIDIRDYLCESKNTISPNIKLSYIQWNNFPKSGYLTDNSCARILPNQFVRPVSYMSRSHSTSAPYKLVGVRDIEHNFEFTAELWNHVKRYHNDINGKIEFGGDLRGIPLYQTGMTGFPDLETEIDRILANPLVQ